MRPVSPNRRMLEVLVFGTACLVLHSCTSPEPFIGVKRPVDKGLNEGAFTQQRAVKACERKDLMDDFGRWFGTETLAGTLQPLASTTVEIKMSSLRNKVSAFINLRPTPPPGTKRGVLFHYGLDEHRNFRTAVTIVELIPRGTAYPGEYDYNENDGAFYVEDAADLWTEQQAYEWAPMRDRYFEYMRVDRDKNPATTTLWPLKLPSDSTSHDPAWYAMTWEDELEKMLDQNNPNSLLSKKVVISCIAEQDRYLAAGAPPYAVHYIMVHRRNGNYELITDRGATPVESQRYLGHGADIGTPCPPRCKKFFYATDKTEYDCDSHQYR